MAENTLRQHVALHGDWNGATDPEVAAGQAVLFDNNRVAYNFTVRPSGHVLVAVDDLISPVLLYSTRSAFDASRAGQPTSLESWIIPETLRHVRHVREKAASLSGGRAAAPATAQRIGKAWARYGGALLDTAMRGVPLDVAAPSRSATVGPLLTTTWGQGSPYNLQTPNDSCPTGHTLTGCVATAWAQLMRYWRWPLIGNGSLSYVWTNSSDDNITLNVDFDAAQPYDWDHMPDTLAGSNDTQNDAVSLLMYHVGMGAQMNWGCDTSASDEWADVVLPTYFRYQAGATYYGPATLSSSERFALLKAELDADPPRPAILSIFATDTTGHEVVVDGYQTLATENMVHINFGWEASYDGYYNIGANFETGSYEWDAATHHVVVGLQPDNNPPVVDAGADQSVNEAAQVQLSGSATDPENVGVTYHWTQTSGSAVTLSDASSPTPTFTAPNVTAQTTLVFQLRADDLNRAWAVDTVSVTVANMDGSSAVAGGGGGGGGGCFIGSLGFF